MAAVEAKLLSLMHEVGYDTPYSTKHNTKEAFFEIIEYAGYTKTEFIDLYYNSKLSARTFVNREKQYNQDIRNLVIKTKISHEDFIEAWRKSGLTRGEFLDKLPGDVDQTDIDRMKAGTYDWTAVDDPGLDKLMQSRI